MPSEKSWTNGQDVAVHLPADIMMPQICKWNKRCTVPWPLGIVSLQLPQLMWQAQLRGFAAIPQWPGAGTAILYLLLAGNDKPIMINQLNLRLRHLNLYNYTHK